MSNGEPALADLVRAVAAGDDAETARLLVVAPEIAHERVERGATRLDATAHYLDAIGHYLYAGDTALHVAAAGYRVSLTRTLIDAGAEVSAKNRRGAEPLHYAADGSPGSFMWGPEAQAETVSLLIAAGADPNAIDAGGVTPLHRAVRTRCAAAVRALLEGGADVHRPNKRGSMPMTLATRGSGRGGSGSRDAKAQQKEIVQVLELYGAIR